MATAKVLFWGLLSGLGLISAAHPKETNVLQDFQRIKQFRSFEFAELFENLPLNDLDIKGPTQEDLLCLSDMTLFTTALKAGEYWALKSK